MGGNLQGRDDDGGGHRPAGASQRDYRAEHRKLSHRGGQKETAGRGRDERGMKTTSGGAKKPGRRAVEMPESQKQASHSFHELLGNLAKSKRDFHIPTAHAKRSGKVENQKQVFHFPLPLRDYDPGLPSTRRRPSAAAAPRAASRSYWSSLRKNN